MLTPEESVLTANHKIFIPIVLSLFILLGLIGTVLIIRKRSKFFISSLSKFIPLKFNVTETATQSHILASSTSETPSIANIMSKNNTDASNYPGSRVQNNNLSFSSVESNKYKIDGNGK